MSRVKISDHQQSMSSRALREAFLIRPALLVDDDPEKPEPSKLHCKFSRSCEIYFIFLAIFVPNIIEPTSIPSLLTIYNLYKYLLY